MSYVIGPFTVCGEHEPETGEYPIRLVPHEHHAAYPWWSESTRKVLSELTPADVKGKVVVDFGCGASAILGIAAYRMGAQEVICIEAQPELAEIARRQLNANGMGATVLQAFDGGGDFVLANIGDAVAVGELSRRFPHGLGTDKDDNVIRW